jgi:hypothetical protein
MNDPHHLVEEFVEHSTENLCSVALQEAGSRQRSYENPAKRLAKQKKEYKRKPHHGGQPLS